jgi:hypothetical protein
VERHFRYFLRKEDAKDITSAVPFREMASTNDSNLVKIVTAVLQTVAILFLGAYLKNSHFWN